MLFFKNDSTDIGISYKPPPQAPAPTCDLVPKTLLFHTISPPLPSSFHHTQNQPNGFIAVVQIEKGPPILRLETPDQSLWTSKTPEKSAHPPRRLLTRRQSLRSVKQVREAAKQLRKPSNSSSPLTSSAASTEIKIIKPNTSKSLPEKYEMLNKFFRSLGSSIRLLRLKGSISTSFGYSHLAQIKFVLPDAIEIKKILVRDDRTSCMKPDLHIGLNLGIVENDEKLTSDSTYLLMNKLFRSRLVRFLKSNPEGDEVPEEMLPEPFNRSNRLTSSNAIQKPDLDSDQDITYPLYEQQPMAASHMPQSFRRHFSKQESDDLSPLKCCARLPETPIKGFDLGKEDLPFIDTPAQSARPPVRGFMTPDEGSSMSPSKLTRRASIKRSIIFETHVRNKPPTVKRVSTDDDDDLSDILSRDLLASIKEKELKELEEKK
ncbi:hypothetical protein L1987_13240 [Smallanthus sonchifolius]|uniref:Uncharacterized protein n=1 Tax=Smallanthus sonchifolius TaxID=185202 RepID=A0ACB9JI97_9ASTR|nr:hypothetical protein L1987_13240 [Smallanthus sonchifolius]